MKLMAEKTLSVKKIRELGLWNQVCNYMNWDPNIFDNGEILETHEVTYDDTYVKQNEVNELRSYTYKVTEDYTQLYPNLSIQELVAYNEYDACFQLAKLEGFEKIHHVHPIQMNPYDLHTIYEVTFFISENQYIVYHLQGQD